jgi:hypothetical protein
LYTFSGWKSPVTALAQAPALDVVAVGLEVCSWMTAAAAAAEANPPFFFLTTLPFFSSQNGKVVVHNIREDGELMSFHHDGGPITAISFRTGWF